MIPKFSGSIKVSRVSFMINRNMHTFIFLEYMCLWFYFKIGIYLLSTIGFLTIFSYIYIRYFDHIYSHELLLYQSHFGWFSFPTSFLSNFMSSTFCLTLKDLILMICGKMIIYQHRKLPPGESSPDLYLKMSEFVWCLITDLWSIQGPWGKAIFLFRKLLLF